MFTATMSTTTGHIAKELKQHIIRKIEFFFICSYNVKLQIKMFKPVFIINELVKWRALSKNPNAIDILEQNMDKIRWAYLSSNPNAIHMIAKLDINAMRENCKPFAEELTAYVFHPLRLEHMANTYGFELDEYMDYIM